MNEHREWFRPRGSLTRDGWESVVDTEVPGWAYTGIHVAELSGNLVSLFAADIERVVVPLTGSFRVAHDNSSTVLEGRGSVFDGPTDVLYVGIQRELAIAGHGRVAVAEAPTRIAKPSRYIPKAEISVELRGAGSDSRQIHNFATPEALDAGALIACEVITPCGNWSSHPAHKHDVEIAGKETQLEEIYYFEAAPARGLGAPADADAFGSFATYSSEVGEVEIRAMVRTGDIALVPSGYHGPAAAAPEYDLYYLNVMAGPGPERAWMFSDDPRQAWIRSRWSQLDVDPRLPYPTQAISATGATTDDHA